MVSGDGGETFLPAREGPARTSSNSWFEAVQSDAVPRAAMDASKGSNADRIYLTWPDFDGKKYVLKVSHSNDLGTTWSNPIVVNDNSNAGAPSNPAIAVNQTGVVMVAFNDRRDDPENGCFRLYFAVSLDGGETFLPNERAAEQPTCPAAPGNWALYAISSSDLPGETRPEIVIRSPAERFADGGDTQGLVAGNDGVFRSAWINGESGVMQVWYKELTADGGKAFQSPFTGARKNASDDLVIEVSEPNIDFVRHTISVKVRLINALSTTLAGPFTMVLDDMRSSLKNIRVLDSDNGMPSRGASWNIVAGEKTSLQPHQKSKERLLTWVFEDGGAEKATGPLFLAHFIILGRASP